MSRRVLTEQATIDRENFLDYDSTFGGCGCPSGHPPCSWCLHEGNPHNQDEDPDCWEVEMGCPAGHQDWHDAEWFLTWEKLCYGKK